MKKIISPAAPESATHTCDVTGASLPNGPSVTLTIKCGYGSSYDGRTYVLDLSEEAGEVVLPLLRMLLLKGAPLESHSDSSYLYHLGQDLPIEKRIRRSEQNVLLRKLWKLSRYRKLTLKWPR
jgi:hypothetical protein